MNHNEFPKIIKEVGFDFDWDNEKVWALKVPINDIKVEKLIWHFDIPFLWENGQKYNLTPRTVLENPNHNEFEYDRVLKADLKYPIDVMENKGRLLILDGLHRLMKSYLGKDKYVKVRIIPRDKISEIRTDI